MTEQMGEPLAGVKDGHVPTGSRLSPSPRPTAAPRPPTVPSVVGGYYHTTVLEGHHTHIRRLIQQDNSYKTAVRVRHMSTPAAATAAAPAAVVAADETAVMAADGTAVMAADETAVMAADESSDDGSMPELVANDG